MPDFTLAARPALGGITHAVAGLSIAEVTDFSLVSLAVPQGGAEPLAAGLRAGFGLDRPAPGASDVSPDGRHRLLWTAPDQMLLLTMPGLSRPVEATARAIGGTAYLTDQSDAWAALRLSGRGVAAALERMVPVDTASEAFPPGRVARTVTEHIGIILVREENGDILLLSARSSARSLLQAVMTTLHHMNSV